MLPQTNVQAPKQAAKPAKQKPRAVARGATPSAPSNATLARQHRPQLRLAAKNRVFDQARSNIFTTAGTTSNTISHDTIQDLPGGTNQSVEQVLLQAPGVSQDSAASGLLHVRNDHANVQFRINGVLLPDGVTGFGSIFDTSFIGSMSLVTGALPAEYGLRTTGLVDITTRTDLFNNSGSVGMYGGSHGTITPSIEYGGTFGSNCPATTTTSTLTYKAPAAAADCFAGVQYYFTGRYPQNTVGIENPTLRLQRDSRFLAAGQGLCLYVRLRRSDHAGQPDRGNLVQQFSDSQCSRRADRTERQCRSPMHSAQPVSIRRSSMKTRSRRPNLPWLSVQKSVDGFDGQLSYFTRYNELRFTPDPIGDLLINGIASDVGRISYTNGIQGDGSYKLNDSHTLRAGFSVSGEQASVSNTSLVEPCMVCDGTDNGAPVGITDNVSKLGWLAGVYVQDEWKLTNQLTMNYGLRFDQMDQFVSANQFSPRLSFTYKPFENTTFHAGYARYFTPPVLVEAAPVNIAAVQQHHRRGVRPERSGVAGALALFRCRRRPEIQIRMQLRPEELFHARTWRRCLLQDRDRT